MVDTSLLIDYFRKTDKQKARLVSHFKNYGKLYISSITEFEVINGASNGLTFDTLNVKHFIHIDSLFMLTK
jgi:predicted nucleic acid-binding protein